ncbi:MarR family winged helix-turn-helix transcriptional regulator [Kordiimonas laminariae]|uniref:MarR family winged helix-turn-helix transcriptional regulator n=1 Tax=Kordiimonas laminariae TaxID=2917717 RepID=UPI001FF1F77C|nr:MarR family transcriptional regulator [Kordiimonas laminariae]MCK0070765.1 MarR family transcriptional regulator [Kordiimonas laminariae]
MNEVSSRSESVDRIVNQWAKERVDLAHLLPTVELVGRLLGTAYKIDKLGKETLQPHGLRQTDFDLLACLRRNGKPYQLTPNDLLKDMYITTGGLTACSNRLIKKGLIERHIATEDKRSRVIKLTPQGLELVNQLAEERFTLAERIACHLTTDEQTSMLTLLRAWSDRLDEEQTTLAPPFD